MSCVTITSVIGAVGGVVGMVFGALGIWFSAAAHRRNAEAHNVLLKRFRREEDEKEVARRKGELLRAANELAYGMQSASTLVQIPIPLESEIDRKAAWELSKEGLANFKGDQCIISIDKMPPELKRGL